MYCYGFAFIPLNLLFLSLGILLVVLAGKLHLALPAMNDDILPMFATQGYLGQGVLILFTIGIIAAAFSNSDSALTAMTTSVCVDLLQTEKKDKEKAVRTRHLVHIILSVLLVGCICLVRALNDKSVIDAIYIIASYTYGPLLGMTYEYLTSEVNNQKRDGNKVADPENNADYNKPFDYNNQIFNLLDTVDVKNVIAYEKLLTNPDNGTELEKYAASYCYKNDDYYNELIGTKLLRSENFEQAEGYLKKVSLGYIGTMYFCIVACVLA